MSLGDLWFGIFVAVIAGYVILDGFDIGVGSLHLVVAKTDEERRRSLNSIGPVWDGNEVWIVLGVGVLFAAFPAVYASLFSGFYVVFMLVLLVMILRTVAIEFRSKRPGTAWRRAWDGVFSGSSLALALLLGLSFGNILAGVTIDGSGDIHQSFADLLTPYAALVGLAAMAMLALHGSLYLGIKTDGELAERARRCTSWLVIAFAGLGAAVVLWTGVADYLPADRYTSYPWLVVIPAGALVLLALVWRLSRSGQPGRAFLCSGAMIAVMLLTGAIGIYPDLIVSSPQPSNSLSIENSAAASNSLVVMVVIAAIGVPLMLLYTTGIYYFFRGKTELGPDSY